ncbi:LPP20 family lipoprotein [Prevotella sp. P6B4]|uniref:LPP20 family lipoprotein n=1 Tax=Prevotella sp. P6B4 TaxID=1410614 RepID=UPI00055F66A2|nr:LPP20 family lipoprotein [Prevotella sp. P6B4]
MTRTIVVLYILIRFLIPVYSQSWDEVQKNSKVYLSGDGWGTTVEEADQQALAALISQISVAVSSNVTITDEEKNLNGKIDGVTYYKSKLQTYTNATLTNTERIVISSDEENFHIGRFIRRAEINRIFEARERTVKEHIRLGLMAEKANKIDDALRNYYWAFNLLKTLQRPAEIMYTDKDSNKEIHPLTWLPEEMNSILGSLDVKVVSKDSSNVDLMFTYKGDPVGSLDYTYFDGRNWSNISSVKNGRGTMEFSKGMIPQNIQIKYEYAYKGQAHINQEIKSVLDVVKNQPLRKARVTLNVFGQQDRTALQKSKKSSESISPVSNEKGYRTTLERVVNAIKNRSYKNVSDCFSEEGMEMFQSLIMYGNARVINTNDCLFYQFGEDVIARSVQMSFSFKNGIRRNFVEDVVFTFNKDGKIDCIAFGLDEKAKNDILNKGKWTPEARQTLIGFLETYKTAYALKRIDYLRTIFDDDAVIIVGHVANKMVSVSGDNGKTMRNQKYITTNRYTKDQYLKNLERCFRSNEFINIRFANNDVRKAKGEEEYGIQIKQDYYSATYGDEGYLYIQVDLEDRKQPIIKVRTWQPEPDPEFGLFDMGFW